MVRPYLGHFRDSFEDLYRLPWNKVEMRSMLCIDAFCYQHLAFVRYTILTQYFAESTVNSYIVMQNTDFYFHRAS